MSNVKLGKKLEVTDIKERMKLLIDGEVFYTVEGCSVCFDSEFFVFLCDDGAWNKIDKKLAASDWYYPAKTYTINGVELVDERVKVVNYSDPVQYVCNALSKEGCIIIGDCEISDLHYLVRNGLVHHTAEAAIAHTKAMIRVDGDNE